MSLAAGFRSKVDFLMKLISLAVNVTVLMCISIIPMGKRYYTIVYYKLFCVSYSHCLIYIQHTAKDLSFCHHREQIAYRIVCPIFDPPNSDCEENCYAKIDFGIFSFVCST